MTKLTLPYLAFDPATRQLRLDPHEPAFFLNPYEAYGFLHGVSNAFFSRIESFSSEFFRSHS